MKRLDETERESVVGGQGETQDTKGVEGGSGSEEGKPVETRQDDHRQPKFTPKGSSITFHGAGRRDGSDVNNAMSIGDFYRLMLGC